MIERFSLALTTEALICRNRPLLKEVGQFWGKYYVKGLRLPPTSIHRKRGQWFCYNSAAKSIHTKKLSSKLYSIELGFYSQKTTNSPCEPSFGKVRGNVRASTIAR